MKLLVLTQKVDMNDDVLGFFHDWLKELSRHFSHIIVICLEQGVYDLPENMTVLSLGKEKSRNRIKYIYNFYRHIWNKRRDYDGVFVHMNAEYAALGGVFWRLSGKPAYLWYNHRKGGYWAEIARRLVNKIFCTSPYSYFASDRKSQLMPAGINTDRFIPAAETVSAKENKLLFLGRISPVKNVAALIETMKIISEENIDVSLDIVGNPADTHDEEYLASLKAQAAGLIDSGKVKFLHGVPNREAVKEYQSRRFFINLTNSGSLDKTILEAMACGCLPLVSNLSFKGILPMGLIFVENDSVDLAAKINNALKLSLAEKESLAREFRLYVENNHSLASLAKKIRAEFEML